MYPTTTPSPKSEAARSKKKSRPWRSSVVVWTSLTLLPLASLYVLSRELVEKTARIQYWHHYNEPRAGHLPPAALSTKVPPLRLRRGAVYKKTANSTRFFMDKTLLIGWEDTTSKKKKRPGIPILPSVASSPSSLSSLTTSNVAVTAVLVDKEKADRALQSQPQQTPTPPHAMARNSDGALGYISDPKALARGRHDFIKKQHAILLSQQQENTSASSPLNVVPFLWTEGDFNVLANYEDQHRIGTRTETEVLTSDYICAFGPGRGMEQDAGYKLITEKIHVYDSTNELSATSQDDSVPTAAAATTSTILSNSQHNDDSATHAPRPIRILCAMYTYSGMRDLARTQALLWGHKCDGFIAFSNETIESLGMIDLEHDGDESYDNMWQKTRSIWSYIYDHYLDDYDYFHLGGDDLYVIVENLRRFLTNVHVAAQSDKDGRNGSDADIQSTPLYFGQWVSQPVILDGSSGKIPTNHTYMVSGGPGYTLNTAAVRKFVEESLTTCHATSRVSYEDRLMSKCLRELGIIGQDTRDQSTGEQQYHDTTPADLYATSPASSSGRRASYHARMSKYWQGLEHPQHLAQQENDSSPKTNPAVGPKYGLDAAATYSVSFHDLYTPNFVARIHALVYRDSCPSHTPLGRALAMMDIQNLEQVIKAKADA
jgi:hypothetical protein